MVLELKLASPFEWNPHGEKQNGLWCVPVRFHRHTGEGKLLTLHVGHTLQFICPVVYTGLFFKTPNCNVIEQATCFCIAVVVQTCPTFIFSVSIFLW